MVMGVPRQNMKKCQKFTEMIPKYFSTHFIQKNLLHKKILPKKKNQAYGQVHLKCLGIGEKTISHFEVFFLIS